jgi:subtilisin family serine protease
MNRSFSVILASLLMVGLFLEPWFLGWQPLVHAQEKKTKRSIIILKDNVDPDDVAQDMARNDGVESDHVFKSSFKGFSGSVPESRLNKIKDDPRVEFVSEDKEVHIAAQAQTLPTGVNRVDAELNTAHKGTGVGVAIIDTGIDLAHPDLAPNIVASKNCIRPNRSATDDNGHGSHVAGIVAAANNSSGVVGVAPEAKLIAVKALDSSGNGTWSSIICAIDWVTANAATYNIKVANMSLGSNGTSDNNCGKTNNDALHMAICRSTAAGVAYVVAAGNDGDSTDSLVPASYDDAVITVSALVDTDGTSGGAGKSNTWGKDDTFARFSSYGPSVDIAAPGVNIYSTYKSKNYRTMTGTSMASPHVAGAAAIYLQTNAGASWSQVRDALKAAGEGLGSGHTDPSGRHPEPVLKANTL